MKLEINNKLQEDIFSIIPKEYNKLEKALFIYNQLCLKLTYSIKSYVDEANNRDYFLKPENLLKVDGKHNTDVVCYTFNHIYLQLLINANIIPEKQWENNYPFDPENPNLFKHAHRKLEITIDGIPYKVDSTYGVLDNNDLTLAKYTTHNFNGWSTSTERKSDNDSGYDNSNNVALQNAIEKVRNNCLKLEENAKKYYEIKKNESNFYSIPLNERVDLFLKEVNSIPDYSLLSFNYLLKLKHKFFFGLELNKEEHCNNIDLLFVKNQKLKEYQALLFVNLKNKLGYVEQDAVEVYLLSITDKQYSKISVDELRTLIKTKQITSRHNDEISKYSVPMIKLNDENQM